MTEIGLIERAKKLGIDIKDTKSMLEALELAAKSLEGARMQISTIVDEMRMHTSLSRERVRWLTRELERLTAQIGNATWPGDRK